MQFTPSVGRPQHKELKPNLAASGDEAELHSSPISTYWKEQGKQTQGVQEGAGPTSPSFPGVIYKHRESVARVAQAPGPLWQAWYMDSCSKPLSCMVFSSAYHQDLPPHPADTSCRWGWPLASRGGNPNHTNASLGGTSKLPLGALPNMPVPKLELGGVHTRAHTHTQDPQCSLCQVAVNAVIRNWGAILRWAYVPGPVLPFLSEPPGCCFLCISISSCFLGTVIIIPTSESPVHSKTQ